MSPFRLRGMPRQSLDRHGPQSAYPVQDEGELLPRHRDLGQLEDDLPGVPHDPTAHFDELDLEASERPVLEPPGQG